MVELLLLAGFVAGIGVLASATLSVPFYEYPPAGWSHSAGVAPRPSLARSLLLIALLWAATPLAFWLVPVGNGNYSPPSFWIPFLILHLSLTVPPFVAKRAVDRPRPRTVLTFLAYIWAATVSIGLGYFWVTYSFATW